MVSRLGFEPRTLALKGELPPPRRTTHSNNPQSCVLHSPPLFGLNRGQSPPVHGQNTDNWVSPRQADFVPFRKNLPSVPGSFWFCASIHHKANNSRPSYSSDLAELSAYRTQHFFDPKKPTVRLINFPDRVQRGDAIPSYHVGLATPSVFAAIFHVRCGFPSTYTTNERITAGPNPSLRKRKPAPSSVCTKSRTT